VLAYGHQVGHRHRRGRPPAAPAAPAHGHVEPDKDALFEDTLKSKRSCTVPLVAERVQALKDEPLSESN
jgi:hypothetical protein